MLCKLCNHERCISKHFKHYYKLHICDDCGERLGYDYTGTMQDVRREAESEFGALLDRAVQRSLPTVLEKIMVENELTFELKVI